MDISKISGISSSNSSLFIRQKQGTMFMNPLARLEAQQNYIVPDKQHLSRTHAKMKSINKIAQSDPNFHPSIAMLRQASPRLLISSAKLPNLESTKLIFTSLKARSISSIMSIQGSSFSMDKSQVIEQHLEQDMVEFQYCASCDDKTESLTKHICYSPLINLEEVNFRLQRVKKMAINAKCQKFDTILYNALTKTNVSLLKKTLFTLKGANSMEVNEVEDVIRMRLLNLLQKKIVFME